MSRLRAVVVFGTWKEKLRVKFVLNSKSGSTRGERAWFKFRNEPRTLERWTYRGEMEGYEISYEGAQGVLGVTYFLIVMVCNAQTGAARTLLGDEYDTVGVSGDREVVVHVTNYRTSIQEDDGSVATLHTGVPGCEEGQ